MSATISLTAAKAYGVERVCAIWAQPRSSFYAWQRNQTTGSAEPVTPGTPVIPVTAVAPARKRGPKTLLSDAELLGKIKADLSRSPFQGEGHRKVWARLRVMDEIRVSRKRILRVMRENQLLSPYRCRKAAGEKHTGTIITKGPNVMWGTDGTRILTVDDGYVWLFSAVEHWSAECVGWHVVKHGTRYAALEPIAMGLNNIYGSVQAGVARGLSLRMDHGTQYLSDHFLKQVRYWGINPSFAFVSEPETNGVAERFNRTIKEQAVYGRVFRNIEEVRSAVADFIAKYNQQWLIGKLGYRSPAQARREYFLEQAA